MSLSPVISTTVLGKRKVTSYILHLAASSSPSEHQSDPQPSTSTANLAVHDQPQPRSKKACNHCTYSGCSKSYSKASRLAEHIRSHTGEVMRSGGAVLRLLFAKLLKQRPYLCTTCQKSFLRESHLQAHTKSHLSDSERPYVCTESAGCQKRFWTLQHLHVHENTHRGAKSYAVCGISIIKSTLLIVFLVLSRWLQ
jgi:general transcription factor IIIA